jgi:hypothetical protein
MDLGIEPVRLRHRRLQVVDDQCGRHAPEVMEGVLQATDEFLRRLPVHRLAVGLAGMTQNDAKDVGVAAAGLHANREWLAFRNDHRRPDAEVDLRFLTRLAFHPPER